MYFSDYVRKMKRPFLSTDMTIYKNLQTTKNQQYLEYATEPKTGHWVSQIYIFHESKLGRPIWSLAWQYYRDRKRKSVRQFFAEHPNRRVKISWAGPPPEGHAQESIIDIKPEEYSEYVDFSTPAPRNKREIFPRGDPQGSLDLEGNQWAVWGNLPSDEPNEPERLLEWCSDLRDARTMSRQARLKGCVNVRDGIFGGTTENTVTDTVSKPELTSARATTVNTVTYDTKPDSTQ
jgi:hypothetical protein